MRLLFCCLLAAALAGCESLPHDGPTPRVVERAAAGPSQGRFGLVDLDYRAADIVANTPLPAPSGLSAAGSDAPNDRIAAGDVLSVSIFEPGGMGVFAERNGAAAAPGALPHVTVDADGRIAVPYAGAVTVAGLTPPQGAAAIRQALRGRAYDPQVLLSVVSSLANSVSVIGEVRQAGRFPISANNDRLLDALASAGGPTRPPADVQVVLARGSASASVSLAVLMRQPAQNVRLAPGDQVRLLYAPRKFSTFGALGRSEQVTVEDETLSLAGALSRAGGLDTNSANASAVMVFRFERPDVAQRLGVSLPPTAKGVPIVYRLNLRQADGYLIASTFPIQADDMVYVPRSDASEAKKFLDLVNIVSEVTYNARVTSVIH
ncbi:polysaccharide biosynthesis/export family protein [Caulobacter sp. KR2-114]|uniref:polysaccharide biosynthesis/export family protein n=1 Tax=Caulobacter sp. KR2-114 TaxID=3400912 RepID=UPI003C050738